jgi:hypothetical protein
MELPLGTAGRQVSHIRRRTGDHKMRGAQYLCDLMDDAKKPSEKPHERANRLTMRRLIATYMNTSPVSGSRS